MRAFNVALSRRLSLHSRCEHVACIPLQLPALWSYLRLPHSQPKHPYTGANSTAQAGHRSRSTVAGQRETVFSPAQQEKRAFQTDQLGSCHPGRCPCLEAQDLTVLPLRTPSIPRLWAPLPSSSPVQRVLSLPLLQGNLLATSSLHIGRRGPPKDCSSWRRRRTSIKVYLSITGRKWSDSDSSGHTPLVLCVSCYSSHRSRRNV